jgi:hypothetical protein
MYGNVGCRENVGEVDDNVNVATYDNYEAYSSTLIEVSLVM